VTSTRLESARAVLVGPDLATAYLSLLQEQLGPRANFLDRKGPHAGRDQLAAAHCEQSHLVTERTGSSNIARPPAETLVNWDSFEFIQSKTTLSGLQRTSNQPI
jgi:hypothetical protein